MSEKKSTAVPEDNETTNKNTDKTVEDSTTNDKIPEASTTKENSDKTSKDSESPSKATKRPHPVDPAELHDEDSVTMLEVLDDVNELEADAKAVLGGADDKNCTYDLGYEKRQPLYACATCSIPACPDFKPAGVCLACSYACHEGHELIELYTKRNFRCDCGNKRFGSDLKCQLNNTKKDDNELNKYNQNFKGLYCICNRPYPDPEDATPDAMVQCVICEDWYHGRHLGLKNSKLPEDSTYSEMICKDCVKGNDFLLAYDKEYGVGPEERTKKNPDESLNETGDVDDSMNESITKPVACPAKLEYEKEPKTLFLIEGWRAALCKCEESCKRIFEDKDLEYLFDENDTVHNYESKSKSEGTKSTYEDGMEALSQMDRVKQIEAMRSYNDMKSSLMDYLKSFAENGKVVKQEDIATFFEKMKGGKKPKLVLPSFCR